jgi:hypothetical protein
VAAESRTEAVPIVAALIVAESPTEAAPTAAARIAAESPTEAATIAAAAGTPALQPEPLRSALRQPQARITTTTITTRSADITRIRRANSQVRAALRRIVRPVAYDVVDGTRRSQQGIAANVIVATNRNVGAVHIISRQRSISGRFGKDCVAKLFVTLERRTFYSV